MKKIILFIILVLFSFVIFNYKIFLSDYYNKKGDIEYKIRNYSGALDLYNKSVKYNAKSANLHNIGNTYFYLGENILENKINLYQKSLESFSGSLNIKFNDYTKYNYDYVQEKLKELNNNQKKEETENQNEQIEKENESKNETSEENISNKENGEQNVKNNDGENKENNSSQSSNVEKSKNQDKQKELSNGEYQELKKYVENLKKQEELNQDYFNKSGTNNSGDPFDIFRESMFDSVFDNGGEKDW